MKLRNNGNPELQYIKRMGKEYRLSNIEESQTKVWLQDRPIRNKLINPNNHGNT